jgi:hypothetical protein
MLPEKMQLLPLFALSLFKGPLLRAGIPQRIASTSSVRMSPTGDERAYYIFHLSNLSAATTFFMVYPLILPITCDNRIDVAPNGSFISFDVDPKFGYVQLPQPSKPSVESLRDDCMYLVDCGLCVYLHVGRLTPPTIRDDVLRSLDNRASEENSSNEYEFLKNMLWQLRAYVSPSHGSVSDLRPTVPAVIPVIQGESQKSPREQEVLNLMIEDSMAGEPDYVDFMCMVHRQVRERIQAKS